MNLEELYQTQEEINISQSLYEKGILPDPIKCSCGSIYFKIYKDSHYVTSACSFRCINNKCKKKYQI